MVRSQSQEPTTVRVTRPMNDHESMTVEVVESNAVRHLVEYDTEELKETLEALPRGATVPLDMARVGARANVWRATSIVDSRRRPPQRAAPK